MFPCILSRIYLARKLSNVGNEKMPTSCQHLAVVYPQTLPMGLTMVGKHSWQFHFDGNFVLASKDKYFKTLTKNFRVAFQNKIISEKKYIIKYKNINKK